MIEISTDKRLLDVKMIHNFLTNAYWAKGRTITDVQKSIDNSLCFGTYLEGNQIGFARICTDYTIFAYIMDLFILPEYRGKGYSKDLMNGIINEPKLRSCQVWMLKTLDAHGLYKQYGFSNLKSPESVMEKIIK